MPGIRIIGERRLVRRNGRDVYRTFDFVSIKQGRKLPGFRKPIYSIGEVIDEPNEAELSLVEKGIAAVVDVSVKETPSVPEAQEPPTTAAPPAVSQFEGSLTHSDAADYLDVSSAQLTELRDSGRVAAEKVSNRWQYDAATLTRVKVELEAEAAAEASGDD